MPQAVITLEVSLYNERCLSFEKLFVKNETHPIFKPLPDMTMKTENPGQYSDASYTVAVIH